MRRLADEEFRKLFRDNYCKASTAAQCQTRYERMINARLEQRYYAADQASVTRTCDANPGRCDDLVAYEMLLLDAHNARVLQEGARAELRLEHDRRRAHAADVNATIRSTEEISDEVAYHLHKGPKCRSFPNVFGGANTICDDGQQ